MKKNGIITNLPYANCMGTSGQGGNLRVDYATLKKIFGKPSINNGNGKGSKIRKEWIISIDGVVCTIYDWKQGYDYTKPKGGMPLKETHGLLAVHTPFLSALFKESLIRIWRQVFSQRLFAWMATFGNRDWVLNPTI